MKQLSVLVFLAPLIFSCQAKAAVEWQRWAPEGEGFQVELPTGFTDNAPAHQNNVNVLVDGKGYYDVTYVDVPGPAARSTEKTELLLRQGQASILQSVTGTEVLSEARTVINGRQALETVITNIPLQEYFDPTYLEGEQFGVLRHVSVLGKNQVVQMNYIGLPSSDEMPDVQKFFSSLVIE